MTRTFNTLAVVSAYCGRVLWKTPSQLLVELGEVRDCGLTNAKLVELVPRLENFTSERCGSEGWEAFSQRAMDTFGPTIDLPTAKWDSRTKSFGELEWSPRTRFEREEVI